jgi:hypothetical protein
MVLAIWLAWTYLPRALGMCPFPVDPRAYFQQGCSLFQPGPVTTLDQGLSWYRLSMPADAQGVRFFIDPGAFNGGDAFFLRFADSPAAVAAFLERLHATRQDTGAETLWNTESGGDPVPWQFDDSGRYAVYAYSVANDQATSGGTVTVDQAAADPVVYVYAEGWG